MIIDRRQRPFVQGKVLFYQTRSGVIVCANITGLQEGVFAFHIHEGGDCGENFTNTGGHYDPKDRPHPGHAGDLPPLFSTGRQAFTAFLTNRFRINEILGKTVIIHAGPDDFTTQPAGNAGEKIACGVISPVRR